MKGILKIVFIVIAGILLFFFVSQLINKCSEIDPTEQVLAQMQAAYNDSMKVIMIENQSLYHKVVDLTDMVGEDDKLIMKLEQDIFSKDKKIIKLNSIIASGVGHIDSIIVIDSNCVGLNLSFNDSNPFRELFVKVRVDNPPFFETKEDFNSFGMTTYLSRDKKGIWNGIAIIDEWAQPYVTISNMKVEIEKDEFMDFYDDISTLKFGPDGSIYTDLQKETIFNFGPRILINETHDISIQKSLNTPGWLFDYSYLFDIIK